MYLLCNAWDWVHRSFWCVYKWNRNLFILSYANIFSWCRNIWCLVPAEKIKFWMRYATVTGFMWHREYVHVWGKEFCDQKITIYRNVSIKSMMDLVKSKCMWCVCEDCRHPDTVSDCYQYVIKVPHGVLTRNSNQYMIAVWMKTSNNIAKAKLFVVYFVLQICIWSNIIAK